MKKSQMRSLNIKKNARFIGRKEEIQLIQKIQKNTGDEAQILIVYGRRRAGKTELVEQSFRDRNLLKFEGIENESSEKQRQHFLDQLSQYAQDPKLSRTKCENWRQAFELLAERCENQEWTIYLEEIQWMANYQDELVSELKYVWDNYLKKNKKIILILCGSAPAFIVNKVIRSSALHNRALHKIHLKPFTIEETREFLGRKAISPQELMDIYMTIGGIPEYLKYIRKHASGYLGICQESFVESGFFFDEYERIFTSSLAKNPDYKKIIQLLGLNKLLTRDQIAKKLKLTSGGTLSDLLADLEESGFIERTRPLFVKESSTLGYYTISDSYLQFYYKFIEPQKKKIQDGHFDKNPMAALDMATYRKWLGFAFERWCRKNAHRIAEKLGFASVKYSSGAYFNRKVLNKGEGVQVDLMFDRADRVVSVCEIKYTDAPIGTSVIRDVEKKIELLNLGKRKSVSRVLISAQGAEQGLINRAYFDFILTLEDLIRSK